MSGSDAADSDGNVTSYKTVNLLNQSQIVPNATATVRDHYPAPMAVRMLLKPLALPRGVNGLCHHAAMLTQRLILH